MNQDSSVLGRGDDISIVRCAVGEAVASNDEFEVVDMGRKSALHECDDAGDVCGLCRDKRGGSEEASKNAGEAHDGLSHKGVTAGEQYGGPRQWTGMSAMLYSCTIQQYLRA